MRRFLTLFVSRREAENAARIIASIGIYDWLWAVAWALFVTVVMPLAVMLIDVREAWLP